MAWFDDLCTRMLDFSLRDHRGEFTEAYNKALEKFRAIEREANKLSVVRRAAFLQDNKEVLEKIVRDLGRQYNYLGNSRDYNEACRSWTEEHDLWHLGWVGWNKAADERGFTGQRWSETSFKRYRKGARQET